MIITLGIFYINNLIIYQML